MNERFEKIYEIAEREGWKVDYIYVDEKETELYFTFENYSPAGHDFWFDVKVANESEDEDVVFDNVKHAIYKFLEEYDVSKEAYAWLDNTGHGKYGAPHDMKGVYEDMENCKAMIYDLWLALEGKDKPTKTKEEQHVFEVFEGDAWLSKPSFEHKATCNSMEEAVNLIMEHGEFDECSDKDYIRDFLMENMQTPTGCIKYIISGVEVGVWNE